MRSGGGSRGRLLRDKQLKNHMCVSLPLKVNWVCALLPLGDSVLCILSLLSTLLSSTSTYKCTEEEEEEEDEEEEEGTVIECKPFNTTECVFEVEKSYMPASTVKEAQR
ncbi:hypothetical protein NQZ68_014014 [Dissostichus eleginoides]|nr:hypothetical protein NQZ68_014014 [Dissostichus eleginoides]